MNILHINTFSHSGGAAKAALRLVEAQSRLGVNAKLLVAFKEKEHELVFTAYKSNTITKWLFYFEKFLFLFFEKEKSIRFSFSFGFFGRSIVNHPLVKSAEIIHLHWVNQGFLSIKNIHELKKSGKKIVWTLHDMWAFTGGCHYAKECVNYTENCGNCNYLKTSNQNDLSSKIVRQKKQYLIQSIDLVITCSDWLNKLAKQSTVFKNNTILTVHNTINTTLFSRKEKVVAKKDLGLDASKKYILFGAASIESPYKGFDKFLETVNALKNEWHSDYEILIFGKCSENALTNIDVPYRYVGIITDEDKMVSAYNAGEIMLFTSKEENLPNMIMESLSCGTPVIAFNVGGVSEMITPQTGFLISPFNTQEAAHVLKGVFAEKIVLDAYSENAQRFVAENFSNQSIVNASKSAYSQIKV